MATNSTRIMVRSTNRDWSSGQAKTGLQKSTHVASKIATVKPVTKSTAVIDRQSKGDMPSDSNESKNVDRKVVVPEKDDASGEKDALVVELEKCLTELENDQGSHATLADDYSKIEKEKDDLLSELEVTFQELEEYMSHVKELEAEKKDLVEERDELTAQVENLKYCLAGRQAIQDQQSGWKDKREKYEEEIKELKERNEDLETEANALFEERQSLISSLLNLNSDQVNEVIKTRSRSSSTVSTDSSASCFLRGENEELLKYLKDAEASEEKALNDLKESEVHIMALKQTIKEQEQEITELNASTSTLKKDTDEILKEKNELEDKCKKMKNDLESLKKSATDETEKLESKIKLLQADVENTSKSRENLESNDKVLQSKIKELEKEKNVLSITMKDLEQKCESYTKEINLLNEKHTSSIKDSDMKIKSLQEEKTNLIKKDKDLSELNQRVTKYELQVKDQLKEIAQLKTSSSLAEERNRTLQNTNNAFDKQIKILKNEKQSLEIDIKNSSNEIDKLKQNIKSITQTNTNNVKTIESLQNDKKMLNMQLTEAKSLGDKLKLELKSAQNQNDVLTGDNNALNKKILENHKEKIEALEKLLDTERTKVLGFNDRLLALTKQVDGDKKKMAELQEQNEKLSITINSARLDNTKLKEQIKRQRMTSSSVQELVQHKLREEKQSLEQRCETLQSALDKANTENKSLIEQLDSSNQASAETIRDLKSKKNSLQFEIDQLGERFDKGQDQIAKMQKEIDSYESFNQAHVDRKLEASSHGKGNLLDLYEHTKLKLDNCERRIAQLTNDNKEYPKKLAESETLINDLQRALSHANDLAMEKSLEVSRSKRNLEKKMEKILKENIELKRKLFAEGTPYSHTPSSTSAPFHSRDANETQQTTMYEPGKNDQKIGFSSAVDLRRIDSPAVVRKTELLTFAQLATPNKDNVHPRGRSGSHDPTNNGNTSQPIGHRNSVTIMENPPANDNNNTTKQKLSFESPPMKPPPPVSYEPRLKKTSTKRDTPHPDKMYHHRTQLSLDGSMDELAAGKLLSGATHPLKGGRLEHWV